MRVYYAYDCMREYARKQKYKTAVAHRRGGFVKTRIRRRQRGRQGGDGVVSSSRVLSLLPLFEPRN